MDKINLRDAAASVDEELPELTRKGVSRRNLETAPKRGLESGLRI